MLLNWIANTGRLWWDSSAIGAAEAQLQAAYGEWTRVGTLAKLERCGPKGRPCIRVDERAGAFENRAEYRVILGY